MSGPIDISPDMQMYKIWRSQPYSFDGALSEYIDNSIQAYISSSNDTQKKIGKLEITINIIAKEDEGQYSYEVKDNATGIEEDRLQEALKPGEGKQKEELNEFGVGLKVASAWLGKVWTMTSRPINSRSEIIINADIESMIQKGIEKVEPIIKKNSTKEHGFTISISDARRINASNVEKLNLRLQEKYLYFIFRSKILDLKILLNGSKLPKIKRSDYEFNNILNTERTEYTHTKVYKIGDPILRKVDVDFSFENKRVYGFIAVLDKLSQDIPGIRMFRYNRLIEGFKDDPNRPEILLTKSAAKHIALRIYGELNLDGQEINSLKGGFNFDQDIFYKILKSQDGIEDLIKFAKNYRSTYEENGVREIIPISEEDYENLKPSRGKDKPGNNKAKRKKKYTDTELHVKDWKTLIPSQFQNPANNSILNSFVIEGKDLVIMKSPNAAALLYRSILELSIHHFIKKTKNYTIVKDFYFSEGKGSKKNYSQEFIDEQGVTVEMAVDWIFSRGKNLYPEEDRNILHQSTRDLRNHIKTLNGIVHGNKLVDGSEISKIRNDTYPLLVFFAKEI